MKKITFLFALCFTLLIGEKAKAQTGTDTSATYIVVKTDGTEFIGKMISNDAHEVIIETKTIGQVAIPKSNVKEIRLLKNHEISGTGAHNPDQPFATRYFITTNGLPIKKGDMYAQLNLFGPEIHYGVTDNLGVGLMTSWGAIPIVIDAKYSIKLDEKVHLGIGTLLGTGSWAAPDFYMALPFAALTYGDRKNNITLSGGYGLVGYDGASSGRALMSISGMATVNKKVALVFDSFIVPDDGSDAGGFPLIMPGLRFQTENNKAFQIGFAGVRVSYTDIDYTGVKTTYRETVPLPIPMLTWFRKL